MIRIGLSRAQRAAKCQAAAQCIPDQHSDLCEATGKKRDARSKWSPPKRLPLSLANGKPAGRMFSIVCKTFRKAIWQRTRLDLEIFIRVTLVEHKKFFDGAPELLLSLFALAMN